MLKANEQMLTQLGGRHKKEKTPKHYF